MSCGMELLRLNDDMLIEILKRIRGLDLEKMKQTCKRILNLAYENSKTLCIGTQGGLEVILTVGRWSQDKVRLQQYRNYAPLIETDQHEIRMKAVSISKFYLNLSSCKNLATAEKMADILKNVHPICGTLETRELPVEFVEQMLNSVDCHGEITLLYSGEEVQRLLEILGKLPYARKLNVEVKNPEGMSMSELFSQIKNFHSYKGDKCSKTAFHDLIYEIANSSDTGNLEKVSMESYRDFDDNDDDDEDDNLREEQIAKSEKLWDTSSLGDDYEYDSELSLPGKIRKIETKQKYILVSEHSYHQNHIILVEKNISAVLDVLLEQLKITEFSDELKDEYNLAGEERRAEIVRDAFKVAHPNQSEEDEDGSDSEDSDSDSGADGNTDDDQDEDAEDEEEDDD